MVIKWFVAQPLVILQTYAFDQDMPQVTIFEVTIGVRVKAWLAESLTEDVVLLKPGPEHREIIDDVQVGEVVLVSSDVKWCVGQMVDNLALTGSGPANKNQNVKRVLVH
jgi:hypothetical protein